MFPTIRIYTFGALQVQRGDYTVSEADWHTRQARQLLKILLTERPRALSADRLIEILWPNSTPSAAATTLRSAINALRNVLEPDRPNRAPSRYIVTQAPGYAFHLHPDIWLDVEVFEKELELSRQAATDEEWMHHLRQAIELYVDDYLTSDPYADWVRAERERLQELYFGAVLQLAELQAAAGNFNEAIAAVRQILARDPVRETAYQALMRFQAATGDSAAALLTYERCRALLGEELGADPSPATQLLHQRILNGEIEPAEIAPAVRPRPAPAPTSPSPVWPQVVLLPHAGDRDPSPFVGRAAELGHLEARLARAAQGHGKLVLLEGEAGIGKSWLVLKLLRRAERDGAAVISGACSALEQDIPFAPLVDLLERYFQRLTTADITSLPSATLGQVAQLAPVLRDRAPNLEASGRSGAIDAADHRLRLIEAMAGLFTLLAQRRPLVLFLDDLQWVDRETLSVLGRLAQRAGDLALLLVLAHRPEMLGSNPELEMFRNALRHDDTGEILPVSPLAAAEVESLVGQVAADAPLELAQELYEVTGGNVLFVAEALHGWLEQPQRGVKARPAAFEEEGRPSLALHRSTRIQELILARIRLLSAAAQQMLQLAAVIGRAFTLDLLEALMADDPLPALDILLRHHLLVEEADGRLRFAQSLVRQVVYDAINPLQRRRIHVRVAQALEAQVPRRATAAELAFHLREAGDSHQLDFARYSVQAGSQLLQSFGFHQAIAYFDAALAAVQPLGDRAPEITRQALQGRGLAYESLLDAAGVAETYGRLQSWAAAHDDRALLIATHSRYSTALTLLGHQRKSHQLLADLYRMLQQTPPEQQAQWDAATHLFADLVERRHRIHRRDPLPAPGLWAPYRVPRAAMADPRQALVDRLEPTYAVLPLFDYGWTLLAQGLVGEATRCLEDVIALATTTAQPAIAAAAYHQLAITARLLGDRDRCQQLLDRSLILSRDAGIGGELAGLEPRLTRADLALDRGDVDHAARQYHRVLEELADREGFQNIRHAANIGLGLAALAQGDAVAAQALLETAVGDPFHVTPWSHVRAWIGLARLAHRQERHDDSADALRRALAYAGERSLLEEYILAVAAAAQLLPESAPVDALIDSVLGHVHTIRLLAAETRLLEARRHLRRVRGS